MVKGTRGRWWWALGARTRAEASCCVLVSHAMHGSLYIQGECRPGLSLGVTLGAHAACPRPSDSYQGVCTASTRLWVHLCLLRALWRVRAASGVPVVLWVGRALTLRSTSFNQTVCHNCGIYI
jgi:hypothetical protein